ncbi:LamG-like jellyroll fold domain-containing protein [Pinibacter soli]|uniref:Gliding motility-associated C-terminal domain-containing protein n=1 Tax=Pinibacter soli TaxID=3044211 RepID=A0ABT6R9R3_9BACT|nr:LamG-like jellyroll fold domain-containing protein [Pinibacter soli]MDI3319216.1 gliding motility-associated C-terminal domain-containing protein [Pinibacter soli]
MKKKIAFFKLTSMFGLLCLLLLTAGSLKAQTLAFPGAEGFGRFATGARGVTTPEVYIVTNLNDKGTGSFRDAVSKPGRIVTFAVGGIVTLASDVVVSPNVYIAGQTATGNGIVFFNKRVTFSGASNTISRFIRVRLGATGNSGNDASGLANGANMVFDHMSISWGMDENFSINWDGKGSPCDNITIQNCIIGQGLFRENHSAGGLIQTPDGGRVSLLKNLYISNKTRNPKVKGVNEFVNNVVYNYGNGGRLADDFTYPWAADAYIMGGSSGTSEVNVINNYFVGGPLTPISKTTPFSRGTGTFNIYGAGNFFDNNQNGVLDGALVPFDENGYPGISGDAFKTQAFPYPQASPKMTAEQAYQYIIDSVGSCYPRRDQVDQWMVDEVKSKGTKGMYVYRETDLPLSNGGLGDVYSGAAPLDTDADGMPDAWEDANGLNKNDKADAVKLNLSYPQYLNIEVYVNSLLSTVPPALIKAPSNVTLTATSAELPAPNSTVVVKWTDNESTETFFVLERSTDGVTYADINHPAANSTTYTDNTGLIPNTTYYYRLKTVSGTDASGYSVPVSVTTPPIPSAPTVAANPTPANGFQYAEISGGKLTLKWTGSANTVTYQVFFGTSPTALTKKADVAYVAAPSYDITGLVENTTYYWRIDAINAKGSAVGNVWSFRTTKSIPAGLVGFWSFDETSGDDLRVVDSSTYKNDGILGLDADDASIRIPGKKNNALDFATANTNMYVVSVPHQDQLFLDKGSFSMSFWMKADPSNLPQDNNTSAYLFCKGSITKNTTTGATGKRFDIEFKNKQLRFAIDDDNDVNGGGKDELQADGTGLFINEWVHVVVIRDTAAKKLRAYQNGTLIKEVAIAKALSGIGETSSLIIGNIGELEFLATTNKPAPYKGKLDELKIYNYALSYPEVVTLYYGSALAQKPFDPTVNNTTIEGFTDTLKLTWSGGVNTNKYQMYFGTDPAKLTKVSDSISVASALYNVTAMKTQTKYYYRIDAVGPLGTTTGDVWNFTTGFEPGLMAHYALDATSGVVAFDSTKAANHGTITDVTNPIWTNGKFKGGLGLSAPIATGAIVVPDAPQIRFDENAFTISMWVNIPSNTYTSTNNKDCYLLQKGTFEANTGKWYGLQLRDGKLTWAIDDGITKTNIDITVTSGATNIFTGKWVHIVAIRDVKNKLLKVYINGASAGTKAYTTLSIGKSDNLLIGNSAEMKPFRDSLDDIRMYNYMLSDAAILKLYNGQELLKKVSSPTPANGSAGAGPEKVNLSWLETTNSATGFNVYVGTSPDSLKAKSTNKTATTVSLDSLKPNTTYYWKVDAMDADGTVKGDVWSFTTGKDVTPPTVVTKNDTIRLSATGTATIVAAEVNNGSNDVYGIDSLSVSKTSFSCANIGNNTVTLTVTDKNGNKASKTTLVVVIGNKPAKPVITPASVMICFGDRTTLAAAAVDSAVSYQWLYNGAAISGAKALTYTTTTQGQYNILAISGQSCLSDTSAPAVVKINGDTALTVSSDTTINRGSKAFLRAFGSGDIKWSPSIGVSNISGNSTDASPISTTTYVATLTNSMGCKVSKSIVVKVEASTLTEYNKLLSPDGDGVNDKLVIKNLSGYPNNRIQIFDRAGKLVYEKNGYNNDWDGRYDGRILTNGTYYFVLTVNNEVKIKGSVTIIH